MGYMGMFYLLKGNNKSGESPVEVLRLRLESQGHNSGFTESEFKP